MMNAAPEPVSLNLGVVLLAAGASLRMGRPKLLLPWGETSVLGHLVSVWGSVGAVQIGVVLALGDRVLPAELDRLGFPEEGRILNPAPEEGMFSSIRCAAAWSGWNRGLTHWVISLGDQPHLHHTTVRRLIDFAASHPNRICQPSRNGRARHPVVLPKEAFFGLADSPGPTLKDFLRSRAGDNARCEIDDPGLEVDLDVPADYQKVLPPGNSGWPELGSRS